MSERDNRPPRLVLPVIAPGGKPDSGAFNNAFQLWARDLNAWVNDNLVPVVGDPQMEVCPSERFGAHCEKPKGHEADDPWHSDGIEVWQFSQTFSPNRQSPRPEWLPDDAEEQFCGLRDYNGVGVISSLEADQILDLITRWYNENGAGRLELEALKNGREFWKRRAASVGRSWHVNRLELEAERDKAIQERDEALKAKRYAEAKTVTAIQDLDELLSDPAHLSVGDAGRIAREHVLRAQAAETALAIALQERDAEAEENRTGMEILADIKAAFPEHVRHQYGPDAVRGIVATLDETHKRAEAAEAKVARVQAYAAGLTKGNEADRCRSAEILAVLDDTITEVSGE